MVPTETQPQVRQASKQNIIFALLCGGFVVNGIVITFIAPILPVFMAKWRLDDGRGGLFSLVQFSASLAGVLGSSALIPTKGFKPAIVLGLGLLGIGFALLNAPTFPLALCASGLYGLGYGFATPGTNLWVAESYGARRASALNVANLAWGLGAISSSPLAMLTIRKSQVTTLLYTVAAVCVALALALFRMPFGRPTEVGDSADRKRGKAPGLALAVALGILFYVYVGTENAVSFWAPTHAERATVWSNNTWSLAPMFFFAGLLGGRGAGAAILLRLKEVTLAVGGILLAAAGQILFLTAHSRLAVFAGAFFAGLGLASLYPIYIAWLSKWFGESARRVGGVMFALAAAGASTMPALVGVISRMTDSLRLGLLVPLAGCAVMLITVALLRPNTRG
jgi:fucose permease